VNYRVGVFFLSRGLEVVVLSWSDRSGRFAWTGLGTGLVWTGLVWGQGFARRGRWDQGDGGSGPVSQG
jgi:hypothetical protein